MDWTEEALVGLFAALREELREEPGVGLALKAEGRNITLRIRSEKRGDDEGQPFFAVVVGVGERDRSFRISYKPSGLPPAGKRVTVIGADSTEELLGLVRRYVEEERRRLLDHQERA